MKGPFVTIDEKICTRCFACIKACPVQAISMPIGTGVPQVHFDRCVGCGDCTLACKAKAIRYNNSKPETIALIESGQKVAAIVDPSIAAEFVDIVDYRKFVKMIESIGFAYIHEVAFGVDVVGKKYNELINNFLGKHYLFSNCPVITMMVEKYYPNIAENLAPIDNPMFATAKIVKKIYGDDIKITYIGPCIAAKLESSKPENQGLIDTVLTFTELRDLFAHYKIIENASEFSDFNPPIGYKGGIYPIAEGILTASGIQEDLFKNIVTTIKGKKSIRHSLDEISTHFEDIHKNFNMFYCEGCIMGPGMDTKKGMQLRTSALNAYLNKRLKNFALSEWNSQLSKFNEINFEKKFVNDDKRFPVASYETKQEILKSIRKDGNRNLDCGNCGFSTCDIFAEAVANNVVNTSLCSIYQIESKSDKIRTLTDFNDKIQNQYSNLLEINKKNINEAEISKDKLEDLQNLLQKIPLAIVLVNSDLKIITSNESFINILGEEVKEINEIIPGLSGADLKTVLPPQISKLFNYVINSNEDVIGRDIPLNEKLLLLSIFGIKKNKVAAGVLKDMHTTEVRNEEIINRVTEVIDLNLNLVQKIAFLLGEAGANTEKMLNTIIESHKK